MMTIAIQKVHPLFVGEVSGLDFTKPVDSATITQIETAMDKYAVLVFHDQHISDEQQLSFSEKFGPLETVVRSNLTRISQKLADISNINEDNSIRPFDDERRLYSVANRLWHTDSSFRRIPAKYSMLSAREVPACQGGETEFADMRAAYDALPEKTKKLVKDLVAVHSLAHSRSKMGFEIPEEEKDKLPPASQRIVRTLPGSNRKTLYLASHASHIVGWPVPEARALLFDLIEFATQREFVYRHHWRVGDIVMWDNRCTMHRVRAYDTSQRRDLRRSTIEDVASTLEQAGCDSSDTVHLPASRGLEENM